MCGEHKLWSMFMVMEADAHVEWHLCVSATKNCGELECNLLNLLRGFVRMRARLISNAF